MKKTLIVSLSILMSFVAVCQEADTTETVSLLFIGDVMGHGSQINAAYDSTTGTYDYEPVFEKIKPVIAAADFAIANLEVTLGGTPYKGYPTFSSPDELALACKNSGIDALVTANNHSCDRAKKGIVRTLDRLDSLQIGHTGTFRDSLERDSSNLLILTKGSIRLGMLNYTYGTNGLPIPSPTVVNLMDTAQMKLDIIRSKSDSLDKLIVFLHWGLEYQSSPSKSQEKLGQWLFENGVDIVIGSHPHVLQRMDYFEKNDSVPERFIAYSLGNFVSNQRVQKRDGGALVALELTKSGGETRITQKG
ncbi:MAG: CapA family protein, partial [Cyclobacteriaceae bacterium]|nr:CapA family protein [Cyclobacteriaceae bacterium]